MRFALGMPTLVCVCAIISNTTFIFLLLIHTTTYYYHAVLYYYHNVFCDSPITCYGTLCWRMTAHFVCLVVSVGAISVGSIWHTCIHDHHWLNLAVVLSCVCLFLRVTAEIILLCLTHQVCVLWRLVRWLVVLTDCFLVSWLSNSAEFSLSPPTVSMSSVSNIIVFCGITWILALWLLTELR